MKKKKKFQEQINEKEKLIDKIKNDILELENKIEKKIINEEKIKYLNEIIKEKENENSKLKEKKKKLKEIKEMEIKISRIKKKIEEKKI